MKILTARQLRQADAYTIGHEPIASVDLMERAARACAEEIKRMGLYDRAFVIFCGTGNNGGDGLALANLLPQAEVCIVPLGGKRSPDSETNLVRTRKNGIRVSEISSLTYLSAIRLPEQCVLVDAIFGTGLSRPPGELAAAVIGFINRAGRTTIAIDIPSGLFSDEHNIDNENIINAHHTFTFNSPKRTFLLTASGNYAGIIHVLDIGLDKAFIDSLPASEYYTDAAAIRQIYRPRKKFSHKGTYGHALIVAGSYGKGGAGMLAAKACLRAGAGLVTAHLPRCNYTAMQSALPEVMVQADADERVITGPVQSEGYAVIAAGPGLGTDIRTQEMLKLLLQHAGAPLVLDADALNILSENKSWLSLLPEESILTPHPGEFSRLEGKSGSDLEQLRLQVEFSQRYKVYVALKGAHTRVSAPDGRVYYNSTGNPGMATAGSGDALTGVIAALRAQGYTALDSAVMGVYLHGLAGDIAARKKSEESMISGDLVECLADAFKSVREDLPGIPFA
ncbi:MAG: NAD(P)H-hydrate dehydratase [Bacteroidota bacterium]